jgi:multidrug transporter EmrE-like cation transporter
MGVFLLTCAIVFNSIANGFFKAGAELQDLSIRKATLIGLGLLIGLANTVCYIKALEKIDLGVAYTVFSAASIILIALISFLFFKEGISLQKAAGLVVVCVGLLLTWKS